MDFNMAKAAFLSAAGFVGGVFATALGGWDLTLRALVAFMIADFFTGLLVALVFRRSPKTESGAASSKAALRGFCTKALMLVAVFLANQMDLVLALDYIRNTVVLALLANEALSLIENLGLAGVPWPPAMQNAIELLTKKGGGNHGDQGD